MPSSTSFPSGHSASAAAFAVAVGDLLPALKLPLRGAASVVASSRVNAGVHHLGDVLIGVTVGALLGATWELSPLRTAHAGGRMEVGSYNSRSPTLRRERGRR